MNWLNKKNTFLIFILSLAVVAGFFWLDEVCDSHYRDSSWEWCRTGLDQFEIPLSLVFYAAVFGVSSFLPALFAFPFDTIVFSRWKRFAAWAAPLAIIISIVLGNIDTGGDIGGAIRQMMIISALLLIYSWFFVHSLVLIIITAIRERRERQAQAQSGFKTY